jgi:hypothetical protein
MSVISRTPVSFIESIRAPGVPKEANNCPATSRLQTLAHTVGSGIQLSMDGNLTHYFGRNIHR